MLSRKKDLRLDNFTGQNYFLCCIVSDRCTQDIGNGLIKYRHSKCTVQYRVYQKVFLNYLIRCFFVHMIERKTKSKMIKNISIDNTINFF